MYVIVITYDWTEKTDIFRVANEKEGKEFLKILYKDACKTKHNNCATYIHGKYAQVVNGINKTVFRLAKVE